MDRLVHLFTPNQIFKYGKYFPPHKLSSWPSIKLSLPSIHSLFKAAILSALTPNEPTISSCSTPFTSLQKSTYEAILSISVFHDCDSVLFPRKIRILSFYLPEIISYHNTYNSSIICVHTAESAIPCLLYLLPSQNNCI